MVPFYLLNIAYEKVKYLIIHDKFNIIYSKILSLKQNDISLLLQHSVHISDI